MEPGRREQDRRNTDVPPETGREPEQVRDANRIGWTGRPLAIAMVVLGVLGLAIALTVMLI